MQPNYVMILSIIWSFILIVLSFYNLYDFILRQENITFELKGKTSSKILMSWRHIRSILDSKKESEVTQSCPTLCDPMECWLPGTPVHGIFQARILGVGCHFILQGIFPTQGSNPGPQEPTVRSSHSPVLGKFGLDKE